MAHTLQHHAVHHVGEWIMHGSPGASDTWSEITADYAGEARKCVKELLEENSYVFFDFTDVSRGVSKWIALGDDDIMHIKYGSSSSKSELMAISTGDFVSIKRVSAIWKVVRDITDADYKTYRFKGGEFVSSRDA